MSDALQPQIAQLQSQIDQAWGRIRSNATDISEVRMITEAVKADLVGVSGNNGLRSEFREYRRESSRRENDMIEMLHRIESCGDGNRDRMEQRIIIMENRQSSLQRWMIGLFFAAVGLIVTIITDFPNAIQELI